MNWKLIKFCIGAQRPTRLSMSGAQSITLYGFKQSRRPSLIMTFVRGMAQRRISGVLRRCIRLQFEKRIFSLKFYFLYVRGQESDGKKRILLASAI